MQKQKGFTIIELIVVIAIIAVLAAIVLVNVTQYINKSKDAAIKGNLATIMTNATVYFDGHNSSFGNGYITTDAATDGVTSVSNAITNAGSTLLAYGNPATQDWCACAMEKTVSTTAYCVDGTGNKKEVVSTTCAAECTTPATGKCQ